jgi:hypothetical protein
MTGVTVTIGVLVIDIILFDAWWRGKMLTQASVIACAFVFFAALLVYWVWRSHDDKEEDEVAYWQRQIVYCNERLERCIKERRDAVSAERELCMARIRKLDDEQFRLAKPSSPAK